MRVSVVPGVIANSTARNLMVSCCLLAKDAVKRGTAVVSVKRSTLHVCTLELPELMLDSDWSKGAHKAQCRRLK